MRWFFFASILLFSLCAAGAPMPQGGAVAGSGIHGQPQTGSLPSTPGSGGGGSTGGATGSGGGGAAASFGSGATGGAIGSSTGGGAGGGAAASGTGWSKGSVHRGRGMRDWRPGDPTLLKNLWRKPKRPLDKLGKAEIYIIVALAIGFITVVIGCWLSDNCWSPEPEGVVTLA